MRFEFYFILGKKKKKKKKRVQRSIIKTFCYTIIMEE
jgi:hypothetical protein